MIHPVVQVPGITMAQTTSPVTAAIRHAILPQNFKIPYIELYDGWTDPLEHLEFYFVWMEFKEAEDAVMFKAFLLTLGGGAKALFMSLRPKTIGSFK